MKDIKKQRTEKKEQASLELSYIFFFKAYLNNK